jgi:hypothetical protein
MMGAAALTCDGEDGAWGRLGQAAPFGDHDGGTAGGALGIGGVVAFFLRTRPRIIAIVCSAMTAM